MSENSAPPPPASWDSSLWGPTPDNSPAAEPSAVMEGPTWVPMPAVAPNPITVIGDVAAVIDDIATSVRGPALMAHVGTLVLDILVVVGLVPAWIDLPDTLAAVISVGSLLVMAGGHLVAWWHTVEKARQHQATVTAPTVALGRHARRSGR